MRRGTPNGHTHTIATANGVMATYAPPLASTE